MQGYPQKRCRVATLLSRGMPALLPTPDTRGLRAVMLISINEKC